MNLLRTDAIILRHIDYGDSDRIVTFFTAEHGVCKGFARGARKSRKRFGAALEPFSQVRMHWVPAQGERLASLREAELVDLRAGLRGDLVALALAGYGCELVAALLGDQTGQEQAYPLLGAFLDHLAAGGAAPAARLLFELRLIEIAGYIPHLLHCAECFGPLEEGTVAFDAARGGSLCAACGPGRIAVDLLTIGTLSRLLRGPVTVFAGVRLSATTLGEGAALVSNALREHLHQPIRSLAFLDEVLRQDLH